MPLLCLLAVIGCTPTSSKKTTPLAHRSGAVSQGIVGLDSTSKAPEWVLKDWAKVDQMAALAQHLDQAAETGTPIIVQFTAKWCTDCLDLEKNVLASEPVAHALAAAHRVLIDVTSVSDESQQLLAIFGVEGLPAILYYEDAVPLAGFLMAPRKIQRPKATATIFEPVDADELLRRLKKSP